MRDALFYALFIGLILWSFWDGTIVWAEAIGYIILYIAYIAYLAYDNKRKRALAVDQQQIDVVAEEVEEIEEETERKLPFVRLIDAVIQLTYPKGQGVEKRYIYTFWMSIAWIIALSWLLVESGVMLAGSLGVSEVIIGLTVLAA